LVSRSNAAFYRRYTRAEASPALPMSRCIRYNDGMSDQFSRLEAQLERVIEDAFTQLFGKTIRPQDIALRLSRAMDDHLRDADDGEARPFAPDHYTICINDKVRAQLLARQPNFESILCRHMIDLATAADYRLNNIPQVDLIGDSDVDAADIDVTAVHIDPRISHTAAMQDAHVLISPEAAPRHPQLIINGTRVIPLESSLINIGRSRDNHIVLDDLHISRHHVQLRLRFGRYTMFDISSQSGTKVNNVPVREHRLQTGDVIRIGKTHIVYIEDTPTDSGTGVLAALHNG